MDIGPITVPSAVNVAVVMGTFGLLVWLGDRLRRTSLWLPLLVFCGGFIGLALLDLADDLSEGAGAMNLALELELAAGSALVLALAGLLHFSTVYPRRVTAGWVQGVLLVLYALALVYVLLAPIRVAPAAVAEGGAGLKLISGIADVLIGYTFYLGLVAPVLWFTFLALRGRNENERKAGRSLALATGPPVAIGFIPLLFGIPVVTDKFALVLFGMWLVGLSIAFARGGLPLPLEASMRHVIDSSADAILVIDRDATVVATNQAAGAFLGLPAEVVGRPFEAVLAAPFKDPAAWPRVSRAVGDAILEGSKRVEDEAGAVGPAGRICRVVIDPLRAEGVAGRADGVVVRFVDITVERAAEDSARRARDLQDLVIRVMGHDLKAPIAVVTGYLDLAHTLLEGPLAEGERAALKAHLEKAGQATSLMREIMANARAISRITMGEAAQAPKESTDLSKMLDEVVGVLRPLAQAKQIPVKVERPDGLRAPLVPGFESVIVNLLSNAIKYTPQGGEVAVHLAALEGAVRLEVADTGPGIPEENRARLFRKFERLSLEQSMGSQGLGLSIASSIVELAGGAISVQDRPDGLSGTVFRVDIPAAEAPPKPAAP